MLDELIQRIENYRSNLVEYTKEALSDSQEHLLEEQREQLLEGKASDGSNLRPLYSEDIKARGGYFKSAKTAASYAAWKSRLAYPKSVKRDEDAPNLYIDGTFHSQIVVEVGDELRFASSTPTGERIMAHYGESQFGLTQERMQKVLDANVTPYLKERFAEIF